MDRRSYEKCYTISKTKGGSQRIHIITGSKNKMSSKLKSVSKKTPSCRIKLDEETYVELPVSASASKNLSKFMGGERNGQLNQSIIMEVDERSKSSKESNGKREGKDLYEVDLSGMIQSEPQQVAPMERSNNF